MDAEIVVRIHEGEPHADRTWRDLNTKATHSRNAQVTTTARMEPDVPSPNGIVIVLGHFSLGYIPPEEAHERLS